MRNYIILKKRHNCVITGAMIFVRLVLIIIGILLALFSALIGGSEGKFGVVIGSLMALVSTGIMTAMMWVWTKLGLLLVAQTGRECEFEADAFDGYLKKCASSTAEPTPEMMKLLESVTYPGIKGDEDLKSGGGGDPYFFH